MMTNSNPRTPAILTLSAIRHEMAIASAHELGVADASFTAEFWVQMNAARLREHNNFVLGTDETTNNHGLHIGFREGRAYFGFYNNDVAGRTRLEPDVWYHVAYVYDRAERSQAIYLNGILDSHRADAGPFLGTGRVYLGRTFRDRFFAGALRELRLWALPRRSPALLSTLFYSLAGTEPGLMGLWPLDEGQGEVARDARAAALVARLTGVTWEPQKPGSSPGTADFPSAPPLPSGGREATLLRPMLSEQSRIEIPDDPALHITGDQTLELWVRPAATVKEAVLLMKSYAAEGALGVRSGELLYSWGVKDSNRGNPGTDFQEVTGGTLPAKRWSHVAVVRDLSVSRTITLYVGGRPVATAPAQFAQAGASSLPLLIGGWEHLRFAGELAEVRVWRTALSPDELRRSATGELQGLPAALVGYWPLSEGEGEEALDRARHLHPIKLEGYAWQKGVSPLSAGQRPASPSGAADLMRADRPALRFDGRDVVTVAHLPTPGSANAMSIEAWVRPRPAPGSPLEMSPVVSRHGPATGWELRCDAERASFLFTLNAVHEEVVFEHHAGEQWLHLAGVFDGHRVALYVNGVLRNEREVQGVASPFPGPLTFGQNPVWQERRFQGLLAEVRYWSIARSPAELLRTLATRLAGDEAGLLGYWPCDRIEQDVLRDVSAGHRHGVPIGADIVASDLPLPSTAVIAAAEDSSEAVRELKRERDLLRDTASKQAEQLAHLQQQVEAAAQQHAAFAREREQLQARIRSLEGELDALRRQALQLKEARDSLRQFVISKGAQVSLQEVIQRSNDEVTRAREVLEAQGGTYRLGRVSLELKMVPGAGGVGLTFPDMKELARLGNTSLSTLNVDFNPREQGDGAVVVKRLVPDVAGFTEVMARRKLAEAGYVVEVCYQAVAAAEGGLQQIDRVVTQMPAKGVEAPPGSTVVLFIGKRS